MKDEIKEIDIKQNEGVLDRAIRIIVGLVLVWLVFSFNDIPAFSWLILIIGLVLVVNGVSGVSFIYWLLKIKTTKK
ncbi:MAG: hypothetical protein FD145_296 [Candidatus Saganbacteria bacterium]|uniref:Inner membrane protein YgaP-like transmembrane domain-containing protein n=1 Tax=Candidatus Saganbacteria bacterium TaxID=2575572 RepID=A0A833P0C3_UNCSA|nr:MAG: hypothetical protein FD145_296 [Candidatus Saganbacteria bacterium]